VVDIGANIGLFGVRALSAVPGGDVTYIGVEPVPANFTALQYNLLGGTDSTASAAAAAAAAGGSAEAAASAGESFFHFNAAYAAAVAAPADRRTCRPYPGGPAKPDCFNVVAKSSNMLRQYDALRSNVKDRLGDWWFVTNYSCNDTACSTAGCVYREAPNNILFALPAGNIQLINKAVSNAPGVLPITFYPRMPGNSTLRPLEKAALQQRLMLDFFTAAQQFEVPIITLQWLLQEAVPACRKVDLLKVDVEGEELAVLQGLDAAGWQRVQQVVVEVHDIPHTPGTAAAAAPRQPQAAGDGQVATDDAELWRAESAPAPQHTPADNSSNTVIDGYWIRFEPGLLSSRNASGQLVMQAAAPPTDGGRVMAVACLLKAVGFRVVVGCCMLVDGVPVNYNVYARRAELCE
jgi:FkbM family methyltransferase